MEGIDAVGGRNTLGEALSSEMEASVSLVGKADNGNKHLAETVGELEVRMDQLMDCLLTVRGSKKKVQIMRKDIKFGRASESGGTEAPPSSSVERI